VSGATISVTGGKPFLQKRPFRVEGEYSRTAIWS
jgi:hypothetical protein